MADCLIAFQEGGSPGTEHMINTARKAGLLIAVVLPAEANMYYEGVWT